MTCTERDSRLGAMPAPIPIGTAIRRARERKRWTQQQLADALGVDVKSVNSWETGRRRPRSSIGAIEQVLGVSLDGGTAGGLVAEDEWEASVLSDPHLTEFWKRSLIEDSRAARAAYEARRRAQVQAAREAAEALERAGPSRHDDGRAAG